MGPGTFAVPAPVWVVGTYDSDGKPNLMTAAWGGICNSRPPCIYVSLRKATYSHGNILARGAYTVSIPSDEHVREADWVGIASGRDVDKFSKAKLTPMKSEVVDAPYVGEFPVVIECKVMQVHELGLHTQFIGEVMDVKADERVLDRNGAIDVRKARPIVFSPGAHAYHSVGRKLMNAFTTREI